MITRNIHEVASELENMAIDEIYRLAKEIGEEEIEIGVMVNQTTYVSLKVYFPSDYEEGDDIDLDDMSIEATSEWYDSDGQIYEDCEDISDLNLSSLLEIVKVLENEV